MLKICRTRPAILRNRIFSAARQMVRKMEIAVEQFTQNPSLGRAGRVAGTRELVVADTPYVIPYRVHNQEIQILRVMHGCRKWPLSLWQCVLFASKYKLSNFNYG